MSAICQNFVQNAWKKELCSNCFKSKDEHVDKTKAPKPPVAKPTKTVSSIIKTSTKIDKPKQTVSFMSDISKVIGYGGEDWSDNDEDFMSSEDTTEDNEYEADGEEEKELQRLTKANTDFNTVNANLLKETTPEAKKSYVGLRLGAPQLDSEGKKQTLLVSVTPFGEDSTPSRRYTKSVSHIPVAKPKEPITIENKKNVANDEGKKNDSEKSLLEEISETLEKGSNRISIMDCKLPENTPLSVSEANEKNLEKNKDQNVNSETGEDQNDKSKDKGKISERKVLLTRAPAIKRSTGKLELYNKNSKFKSSKENLNIVKTENDSDEKRTDDSDKENQPVTKEYNNVDITERNETCTFKKIHVEIEKDLSYNEKGSDSEESNKTDSTTDTDTYENMSNSETANSLTESMKDEEAVDKPKTPMPNVKEPGSRELAGEPDGHADPDGNNDVPALPPTSPPFETRSSFLHGPGSEKPKPPSGKPATVLIRKPAVATNQHVIHPNVLTTFSSEPQNKNVLEEPSSPTSPTSPKKVYEPLPQNKTKFEPPKVAEPQKPKLTKTDSTGSDYSRFTNKRRAPMPPPAEELGTFSKKPMPPPPSEEVGTLSKKSQAPLPNAQENSKKEKSTTCSLPVQSQVLDNPNGEPRLQRFVATSEAGPRRGISISSDNLVDVNMDDKKKEKIKQRFSLKKFLRISSSKESFRDLPDAPKSGKQSSGSKQRLEIVHPSELNGEKIEVVAKPVIPPEIADYSPLNIMHNGIYNSSASLHSGHGIYDNNRTFKPAPPPRNLDLYGPASKPNLPHAHKPSEPPVTKQKTPLRPISPKSQDTVYANIGEVRSAITPNKPQRTASMREREALAATQAQKNKNNSAHVYEPINVSKDPNENVYDYINGVRSSSPECDSSSPSKNSPVANTGRIRKALGQGKSSSNIDVSGEGYNKYSHIPRSASLTYCGSETESEIYSPYGFCGSEGEIFDDEREWLAHGNRTHKLRSRKGRSIMHKNLEDNYGAVVVANHEALAQVLENITHVPTILPALRGLKAAVNLRWSDFNLKENHAPLVLGTRIFHQALWGAQHVTLVVNVGTIPSSSLSLGNFNLIPITEFVDLIPAQDVPSDTDNLQATIAVHPWMQVHSIKSYSEFLKSKPHGPEDSKREASFIVLQLVNALKMLQAQGIEELPDSLSSFVLCREMDKESHYRLCILQGLSEDPSRTCDETNLVSLCTCASKALMLLMPDSKLTSLLRSLLNTERAVSLTQVKSVLEFSLWGPSDVSLSTNIKERELALQRWLDLQRATVLHGLVCAKVQLTVYEECHLMFLVRSNSKMICDASLLVDSVNMQNSVSKV